MGQKLNREKSPKLISDNENSNEKLIKFSCYKEVDYGKAIYIVGNHDKLGALDITKSIRLQRDQNFPIWRSEIRLKPNDYFYRFIVLILI